MELISRDEVMRLAESGKLLSGSFGERAKDIINSLPTIEKREEGHWIHQSKGNDHCSRCKRKPIGINRYPESFGYKYCPYCGVMMI